MRADGELLTARASRRLLMLSPDWAGAKCRSANSPNKRVIRNRRLLQHLALAAAQGIVSARGGIRRVPGLSDAKMQPIIAALCRHHLRS